MRAIRWFSVLVVALFLLGAAPASAPAPVSKPAAAAVTPAPTTPAAAPAPAASQPSVKVEAPVVAPVTASAPSPAPVPDVDTPATPKEVIDAAAATVDAASKYFTGSKEGDSTAKSIGLAALISIILKLLLSLLRLTSPFWSQTRGKWVLRLITILIGVAVGVLANMAVGMPWWNAVIIGLSGPGAISFNEYWKMVPFEKKKPA